MDLEGDKVMNKNIKFIYLIDFDLNNTSLSYLINLLCDLGEFAVFEKKYYIKTNLSKDKIIKTIKKHLQKDEQIIVKQFDNLSIFCFNERTIEPIKKVTYDEASKVAINKIDLFLNTVYGELQNQIKERGE